MGNEVLPIEKLQQFPENLGSRNFGDVMVVGGGVSGIQREDVATEAVGRPAVGHGIRRHVLGDLVVVARLPLTFDEDQPSR